MKIKVTWLDIKNGDIMDVVRCPVAKAMTRAFGVPVEVGWESARWHDEGFSCDMALPSSVRRRLKNAQDNEGEMHPFTFDIADTYVPSAKRSAA